MNNFDHRYICCEGECFIVAQIIAISNAMLCDTPIIEWERR